MNFSQLHEQLRQELLRRIERGTLSGVLLARQTGLKPAHISNFLRSKRRLSLHALDLVLAAQFITIGELQSRSLERNFRAQKQNQAHRIALVSQSTAMYESQIRESSVLELVELPSGSLDHLIARRSSERRSWERFIAVRISYEQAAAMLPVIAPHAILVIDRHYNSLQPYRPPKPNIYAVCMENTMLIRYADFKGNSIILRPHNVDYQVELIELKPEQKPAGFIVGRVCATIAEL